MISIEDYFQFNNGDRIVIGCSSGPDSMALFDMLLKVREKYNLELICAHVNHNLRKQSVEEAEFMKKYCAEHDVMFEGMLIEKYGDDNFHNEARNIKNEGMKTPDENGCCFLFKTPWKYEKASGRPARRRDAD